MAVTSVTYARFGGSQQCTTGPQRPIDPAGVLKRALARRFDPKWARTFAICVNSSRSWNSWRNPPLSQLESAGSATKPTWPHAPHPRRRGNPQATHRHRTGTVRDDGIGDGLCYPRPERRRAVAHHVRRKRRSTVAGRTLDRAQSKPPGRVAPKDPAPAFV